MDDFYIGYEPPMPRPLARFVGRITAAAIVGAVVAGAAVVAGHVALDGGSFDYGRTQTVTGRILAHPYPRLIESAGTTTGAASLLVASGKHGARPLVQHLDGRTATFEATRITRDGHVMLEMRAGTVRAVAEGRAVASPETPRPAGARDLELQGEIVDTKCYLGVMVPGEGHTHRACASLCLRGGIPAALRVRDARGGVTLYLLESPSGSPVSEAAAALAGRPVVVAGVTGRRDGWPTIRTNPATWREATR